MSLEADLQAVDVDTTVPGSKFTVSLTSGDAILTVNQEHYVLLRDELESFVAAANEALRFSKRVEAK